MFSPSPSVLLSTDVDMEVDHFTNGVTESSSNGFLNGSSKHAPEPDDCEADMGGWSLSARAFSARGCCGVNDVRAVAEVESAQNKRQLCGGSQAAIERMIHFGRELQSMSEHLRRECGKNSANKKMLKVNTPPEGLEEGAACRELMLAVCCCRTPSASWPTRTPGTAPSDTSWTPSRGSRSAPPSTVQY